MTQMLNVAPYQLQQIQIKKKKLIKEWKEEGAAAVLVNSPGRGYTNEAIGKVVQKDRSQKDLGKELLGKK